MAMLPSFMDGIEPKAAMGAALGRGCLLIFFCMLFDDDAEAASFIWARETRLTRLAEDGELLLPSWTERLEPAVLLLLLRASAPELDARAEMRRADTVQESFMVKRWDSKEVNCGCDRIG